MPIIILSFNVFATEKKNGKSVINENKLGKVQVYFNMDTAINCAMGGIYRIFGMFIITAEEADVYAIKYQADQHLKKSDWKKLFQSNSQKYIWPRYHPVKLEQKMIANPTIKENIQSMIGNFDLNSCDDKNAQMFAYHFEQNGETYFVKPNVKRGQDEDDRDDELEDGEVEVIEVDDATEPDQDEDQKNQERKEFRDEEDPNDPDYHEDEEDEDSNDEGEGEESDQEESDSNDEDDEDEGEESDQEESDSDEDSEDEDAAFRTPKRHHQAVQPMAPRKQSANKRKIQPRSSDPQPRKQGRTLVYEF